ncbi:hypothetical protein ABFS83_08G057100 [Erythranthe nasuta]
MMNVVWLLSLSSILLCSTAAAKGQEESVELLTLQEYSSEVINGVRASVAVQMETEYIKNVSTSVLMAEAWLRNSVLAHYPGNNVTTIVVGRSVLCNRDEDEEEDDYMVGSVLPAVKNIHYSLTRWGLEREIKVSSSFSSDCLANSRNGAFYRAAMAESYIKPLLAVLKEMGSPYVVDARLQTSSVEETLVLVKTHLKSMENLAVSRLKTVYVIAGGGGGRRKLSVIDLATVAPVSSKPAFPNGSPLPPLVGIISPTPNFLPSAPPPFPPSPPSPAENPTSPPFLPVMAPVASPPYGPHLPPCEPSHGGGGGGYAGAPVGGVKKGLWCVAKPTVPAETLQEALDYACGEGGGDCEAIVHGGSCYFPDTVVAHASYAFNNYWQKTKNNGGTCGFGGTAMLINSDPSYRHCRFILT